MGRAVEARFGRRIARQRPGGRVSFRFVTQPHRPVVERLAGLDLLRLLAALAIVLFHFGYAGAARGTMQTSFPELSAVAKYGFVGVDLFFVISGFVIAVSAEGRSWHQFAASRFLRLYPAHVFCMTVTAIALLSVPPTAATPTFMQWLANLTMLAPAFGQPFMDGAYWSIVIEIVFYGWVALLLAAGLYQRRLLTIVAIWLAVSLVNEAVFQWRPLRLVLVTEYAGMFASGMLIHRIRSGERSSGAFALLGFAIMLGALHAFEGQRIIARIYGDTVSIGVLWALHGAIYASFVAALWFSRRLPATPAVLMLGGLTYPIYLVHQTAGYKVIDALTPLGGRWLALFLTLAALAGLGYLVWRFVEPVGRTLSKRIMHELAAFARGPIGVTSARH